MPHTPPCAPPPPPFDVDLAIIGAGASGLLCAHTAATRGLRVCLIDHAPQAGRKIAVSGGGKANFTNRHMGAEYFLCNEPGFCGPALAAFPPAAMLALFTRLGLRHEERAHGQLFGVQPAKHLARALARACTRLGCQWRLGTEVTRLATVPGAGFGIECADGARIHSPCLALATGSPAWPQCGATAQGAQWARELGHHPRPFTPVLTPLVMPADWPLHGLAGISLPVRIHVGDYAREDALLFTHNGISGPATLQASCRWTPGQAVHIDFLPQTPFAALLDAPECARLYPRTLLARHLPQRLADALLPADSARRKIAELSRKARTSLHEAVHRHCAIPTGTGGLAQAEAARGGVPPAELDPQTMESRLCPGLYVIGELVDVTGHLGGYNLHWAWASGHLAGAGASAGR